MSVLSRDVRGIAMPSRIRLGWLLPLGLLILLVAGLVFWIRAGETRIIRLRIAGDLDYVSAAQVQAVAAPFVRAGFFDVDIDALHRAIESMPWVRRARVSRHWPGTVGIRIWEHDVLARWGADSVLTADGDHFTPAAATLPEHLPVLHGPLGTEDDLIATLRAVRQPLAIDGFGIERLWIDARGSWNAELDTGLVLHLGRDRVRERLRRFTGPVTAALGARLQKAAYVDLRYTNGFAVGWRDAAGPQAGEK